MSSFRQELEAMRQEGNVAFSAGDFKTAIRAYSDAIKLCLEQMQIEIIDSRTRSYSSAIKDPLKFISNSWNRILSTSDNKSSSQEQINADNILISSMSPQQINQASQFKLCQLYSNRSVALLNYGGDGTKRYEEALLDAEICIRMSPEWPKGYFRKAEALIALRRLEESLPALIKCLETTELEKQKASEESIKMIQKRILFVQFEMEDQTDGIRIVQMLAGREFARSSWSPVSSMIFQYARSMQNHVYAICCETTRQSILVDVCWDVDGILDYVERVLGYNVVGAIVTHYHFDHVGGTPPPPFDKYRVKVDGIEKLMRCRPAIRTYIHSADINQVLEAGNQSINIDRIIPTRDGMEITLGTSVRMQFIHTPGHTPGSQCILVNGNRLLSGDTLFIKSVGRLDFPDSDLEGMFSSMKKISKLSETTNTASGADNIAIYPGHSYGGPFTTLADELVHNASLNASSFSEFVSTIRS